MPLLKRWLLCRNDLEPSKTKLNNLSKRRFWTWRKDSKNSWRFQRSWRRSKKSNSGHGRLLRRKSKRCKIKSRRPKKIFNRFKRRLMRTEEASWTIWSKKSERQSEWLTWLLETSMNRYLPEKKMKNGNSTGLLPLQENLLKKKSHFKAQKRDQAISCSFTKDPSQNLNFKDQTPTTRP